MASITISPSTPRPQDTRWTIRAKAILAARTTFGITSEATKPLSSDTRRRQLTKINTILNS